MGLGGESLREWLGREGRCGEQLGGGLSAQGISRCNSRQLGFPPRTHTHCIVSFSVIVKRRQIIRCTAMIGDWATIMPDLGIVTSACAGQFDRNPDPHTLLVRHLQSREGRQASPPTARVWLSNEEHNAAVSPPFSEASIIVALNLTQSSPCFLRCSRPSLPTPCRILCRVVTKGFHKCTFSIRGIVSSPEALLFRRTPS